MAQFYDGLSSFVQENGVDRVFTFWVYRQVYTPYEIAQAYTDESIFEDIYGRFGVVKEVVNIGKDHLVGIVEVFPEDDYLFDEENYQITYYPLSRLQLKYDPNLTEEDYEEEG